MDKCFRNDDASSTFKFNFREKDCDEVINKESEPIKNWIPAAKVNVSTMQLEQRYEYQDFTVSTNFLCCPLKLLRSDKVLQTLKNNYGNMPFDQLDHSDLIPAVYEGGLKIWEATYDIEKHLIDSNIELEGKQVLDLGCGVGVIGIIAFLKGANVHFQDYNLEVINCVTIPNVLLNAQDQQEVTKRCNFYCGDWESFATLRSEEDQIEKYDLIFTTETIYNPSNYKKLYSVFKNRLRKNGVVYIAAKSNYFGVGGGARTFEQAMIKDGLFDTEVIWTNEEGLQREIMKLTWKHNDEI